MEQPFRSLISPLCPERRAWSSFCVNRRCRRISHPLFPLKDDLARVTLVEQPERLFRLLKGEAMGDNIVHR